ncbi:ATP-binding cassette subfamily C member 4-like [Dysidea avara]|uniref:ATP-binding cassette subfamily C member 4-like n=1 Tax=Dysidea avara TaxID=196820 RepID=UPI00332FCA9B
MDVNEIRKEVDPELPANNPRKQANLISKFFFAWLDPLIWTGYRRELKQEDLYATPEAAKSQKLLKDFKTYWTFKHQKETEVRLWLALLQFFKVTVTLHGTLHLCEVLMFMAQAVLVGYLSQYFCEKNSLEEELTTLQNSNKSDLANSVEDEIKLVTRNAFLYAAGIALLGIAQALIHAWALFLSSILGMKIRVLLTAAIYDKSLHLSHSTIGQLSIGHIVNLASNDVQRYDLGVDFAHMWWIFLVTLPLLVYLLWSEIGPSCLVGLGLVFVQPPLQYILGRLYTKLWLKSAKVTDKRVRVMNEIISGMRLIKMYAWEWAFHEYVKKIRKKESNIITKASMIRGVNQAIFYSLLSLLGFITFSMYTGLGNSLTPKKVFTVLSLYGVARFFFVRLLATGVLGISEMWAATIRIEV